MLLVFRAGCVKQCVVGVEGRSQGWWGVTPCAECQSSRNILPTTGGALRGLFRKLRQNLDLASNRLSTFLDIASHDFTILLHNKSLLKLDQRKCQQQQQQQRATPQRRLLRLISRWPSSASAWLVSFVAIAVDTTEKANKIEQQALERLHSCKESTRTCIRNRTLPTSSTSTPPCSLPRSSPTLTFATLSTMKKS